MTENKGDLISREALKKAIMELPNDNPSYYYTGDLLDRERVIDEIDNAPTVEPKKEIVPVCKVTFDKEQLQEIVDKKVAEMIERPQGKWIVEKDVYCRCPFCNFKDVKYSNYCPDCGADMRPKPNQLRDCENCIHHSDNGCEVWECEFEKRSDV